MHHFLHQLLARLLVGRIMHDVDQLVGVLGEIEELFPVIAPRRDRVAELTVSQRLFPRVLHGQLMEGRLAQVAERLGQYRLPPARNLLSPAQRHQGTAGTHRMAIAYPTPRQGSRVLFQKCFVHIQHGRTDVLVLDEEVASTALLQAWSGYNQRDADDGVMTAS